MQGTAPTIAMLLSAGLGTRMRPLTETTPKPLLLVRGRTIIDRTIDHLLAFGIKRVIVNLHHLGGQIREHLKQRTDVQILFLDEPTLLDTGGAIKNALRYLGPNPFFAINADQIWTEAKQGPSALSRLAAAWNDKQMDACMLMHPLATAFGFDGSQGDFHFDPVSIYNPELGRLFRRDRPVPRPFVWMSVQLISPKAYAGTPDEPFSNNLVWNRLEVSGRLFGIVHKGGCYQIGTPQDLARTNRLPEFGEIA